MRAKALGKAKQPANMTTNAMGTRLVMEVCDVGIAFPGMVPEFFPCLLCVKKQIVFV